MTFNRGINSKYKSKDFLQRGLKSMFPTYEEAPQKSPSKPPMDTEKNKDRD